MLLPELDCDALPLSVLDQGRIRLDLIREAVSWLRTKSLPAPRSVREIASRIMELYFPTSEHLGDVHAVADHEDAMIAALDAPGLAQRLRDDLGTEASKMLRRRLDGTPLVDLAADSRVAVSTAHDRMGKAVERVRAQVRRHRLRREGLEPVLALVGV